MSGSTWAAALGCAVAGAAVAPYLARLTLTVPKRATRRWWTGAPAAPRRTLVTVAVAVVLAALAGLAAGASALLPALAALAGFAAPLVVIDVEHHRLPNRLVVPLGISAAVLLTLAAAVRDEWPDLLRAGLAAVIVYALFQTARLVAPSGFGGGDVRLAAVLAGYLGYRSWSVLYLGLFAGFGLGALAALVLMASGRAGRRTPIAFGPMLVLGALLVLAIR